MIVIYFHLLEKIKNMKLLGKLITWILELPYSRCNNCFKKGVRFSYEDHFGTGKDVYECKYCKNQFV